MELNLALTATHNRHCTVSDGSGQLNRQLLEGFNPRVELKETRSSYSLNVHLPGFRREDIRLEMDNTRTLLVRGQTCLEGLGIVSWTWHLMESSAGRRNLRRPFKIPHNVNVPSITGSFHDGVLHIQMPKLRSNRFSPYHINGSTRNRRYYDPPGERTQGPDRALITDRSVQFRDELMAEANEPGGDYVPDHSNSQRLPHCPEEEDECTILTERSVDMHVPEGSSSDILSSQEENEHVDPKSLEKEENEHGDPKSLEEEMKEASNVSQNPQDQKEQQPPPVDKLCSDTHVKGELDKIMEEDIEHPTADHEEKTLQEADDAGNSHCINSIKSTVEEQGKTQPHNSEAEEENSGERVIPANYSLDMIGDLHPKRFFSKTNTKILLTVILSAAALVAARKLMRRL